jgi:hypothetical protein
MGAAGICRAGEASSGVQLEQDGGAVSSVAGDVRRGYPAQRRTDAPVAYLALISFSVQADQIRNETERIAV